MIFKALLLLLPGTRMVRAMWITMKKDGPEIAMITLNGIWDCKGRDLKIEETYERTAETQGMYKEP